MNENGNKKMKDKEVSHPGLTLILTLTPTLMLIQNPKALRP